jgi:Lrp/AsnC family leucine-responsive transcriptional regulator
MDATDKSILDALRENARQSASEISKAVHLSVPAVAQRIKRLEETGVIEQYTVRVSREKTDKKLLAFILVTLGHSDDIADFRRAVALDDNVLECHHIAGEYDYLLKVQARDTGALEEFLSGRLKRELGVAKSNTLITLLTLKEM